MVWSVGFTATTRLATYIVGPSAKWKCKTLIPNHEELQDSEEQGIKTSRAFSCDCFCHLSMKLTPATDSKGNYMRHEALFPRSPMNTSSVHLRKVLSCYSALNLVWPVSPLGSGEGKLPKNAVTKSPFSPNFSPGKHVSEHHSTFKCWMYHCWSMLGHILHRTSRILVQKLVCCHNS